MSVRPFDTSLIKIPASVAKTSDALAEALARGVAVRTEASVTAEQLASAKRADAAAAREAVAAGKTPPAATATKAAEENDRAQRAVPAAEQLVRHAEDAYLAAVRDRFEELRATLDDRQRSLRDEADRTLDALGVVLRELIDLDDLGHELNLASLQGRHRDFAPVRRPRRKDPTDEILGPVRAALGGNERRNTFARAA